MRPPLFVLLTFLALSVAGCSTPAPPLVVAAENTARASHCPKLPPKPTREEAIAAAKIDQIRGLLYEIRNRTQVLGYLYGTVHANRHESISLGPRVVTALINSDLLAVELNLADPDVREGLATGSKKATRSFDYTQAHLQKIDEMIEQYCAPELLRSQNPDVLVRSLLALDMRSRGVHFEFGAEKFLHGLADALNKPVGSLESVADHLAVRRGQAKNYSDSAKFVSYLDSISSGKATRPVIRMIDAWADGDVKALSQHCAPRCATLANRVERDKKIAQKIDSIVKSGKKVFAAVGSLHLLGDRSIQKLLEDRGYFVTRVR